MAVGRADMTRQINYFVHTGHNFQMNTTSNPGAAAVDKSKSCVQTTTASVTSRGHWTTSDFVSIPMHVCRRVDAQVMTFFGYVQFEGV